MSRAWMLLLGLARMTLWAGILISAGSIIHSIHSMRPEFAALAKQQGLLCFDDCPRVIPTADYLTALHQDVSRQNIRIEQRVEVLIGLAAILLVTEMLFAVRDWFKRKPKFS